MSDPQAAEVVAAFNLLGYRATFAAVAKCLEVDQADLYCRFASRDDLAAQWLLELVPNEPTATSVRALFSGVVLDIVRALNQQRDFAHAWLTELPASGPWHLPELAPLHEALRTYFEAGLIALRGDIALPDPLEVEDVVNDLADAMCAMAAGLVLAWHMNRNQGETAIESVGSLLDALLMRRADISSTSLLVHLHRLTLLPHERFGQPLIKLLLEPRRVARLGHASALVGLLRDLLPPHQPAQP